MEYSTAISRSPSSEITYQSCGSYGSHHEGPSRAPLFHHCAHCHALHSIIGILENDLHALCTLVTRLQRPWWQRLESRLVADARILQRLQQWRVTRHA